MADITIYHNDTCTKSNAALTMLQEWNIPHNVRMYAKEPLTIDELRKLLKKLKMQPSDLVRRHTQFFKDNYDGKGFTEEEWLAEMAKEPELIERPILEKDGRAVIGRPAEKLFDLLD